ncbi:MAG: cation:proton antiporter [Anaerolineae bacterium]|nr:cation:proton antiporter [Anaerolineae bacterium]
MVPNLSLTGFMVVAAVAFLVPLLLGLAPRLRLPSVVVEIVAGIVIGPSVLGLVRLDLPIQVLALFGLAFTLFLAGLEIDFARLRGPLLRLTGLGFLVSLGLSLAVGLGLARAGLAETPLFIGIVLAATSLGVIIPLLKDSGQVETDFGQLVLVGASIADFGTIILLSLFFSREATSVTTQTLLIAGLAALGLAATLALRWVGGHMWFTAVLSRLQDTSAQIRVRGAFALLAVFVALAERFGLEIILGAFIAGAILNLTDRDEAMTHTGFRHKLEAVGFGVFIPAFFIASGVRFNLAALFTDVSALARVPLFLAALLVVRGLPALLYRGRLGGRQTLAAGLLQATQLSFVVVAAQIGMELRVITDATGAALVAAALLSALLFPLAALTVLRGDETPREALEVASAP